MNSVQGPLIVVGVDGSDFSHKALNWAIDYATKMNGRLHIVMAWEIPLGPWAATGAAVDALFAGDYDFAGAARARLDDVLAEWLNPDLAVPVESEIREGNPAQVVVTAATELGADLIVVGSRGLGGFRGVLLGSVSQRCVSHAQCPVVIVR